MSYVVNITSLQSSTSQVCWWKAFALRKHHVITGSLFYNFRRKTFNDEKHLAFLRMLFRIPMKNCSHKLRQEKRNWKSAWLRQGKAGLYHSNMHFGDMKSSHGKVKSAGAQKSLTVHPGIQIRGKTHAWSTAFCVEQIWTKEIRGASKILPQGLNHIDETLLKCLHYKKQSWRYWWRQNNCSSIKGTTQLID